MKSNEYIQAIKDYKGSNLSVEVHKQLKTKVANRGDIVEKHTRFVCRTGINYDNMKATKEGRDNGSLPKENQGLPWGEWSKFPFIINHKGGEYFRLYPSSDEKLKPHTEYFINGKKVNADYVKSICLASEFSKSNEKPLCWTIKAENVKSIGKHQNH
jgi:hypothetical protein